jgi:hypothetical protein
MSRYKYSSLKELTQNCAEYNFYGVIYDASFPIYEEKDGQYHCTLRIIDPEINCLTYPQNLSENLILLTVKSSDKESLPYIHSVGEIIRVHRGVYVILPFKIRKASKRRMFT